MKDRASLRILVADDNLFNQHLLLQMLKHLGCSGEAVKNGLEVLEKLQNQPYDLIFLDINMPEMNGLTTARRICTEYPDANSRPYLVAVTGNVSDGDKAECLEAGMNDYLVKPVDLGDLTEIFNQLPFGQSPSSEAVAVGEKKNSDVTHSVVHPNLPNNSWVNKLTPASLDPDALKMIHTVADGDSRQFFHTMIHCYLDDSPNLMQVLKQAISQQDSRQLAEAAHSLKSMSAGLGAKSLAQLCQSLETMGKMGKIAVPHALLREIEMEYERVKLALDLQLRDQALPA